MIHLCFLQGLPPQPKHHHQMRWFQTSPRHQQPQNRFLDNQLSLQHLQPHQTLQHPKRATTSGQQALSCTNPPSEILHALIPPGASLSIDQAACRWRAKYLGQTLPSVGFGPFCTWTRRSGLVHILEVLWMNCPTPRPLTAYIESVPEANWEGLLDDRVEHPRKYQRHK